MKLRNKYKNFVINKYGQKYNTNIINLGYSMMKIILGFLLLLFLTILGGTNSDVAVSTNTKTQTENLTEKTEQTQSNTDVNNENNIKPKVSREFKNALVKAESYSRTMHMSKRGIYEQLTSEYGEQFPAEAAQYAIDNMSADFEYNALQKAKTYQSSMNMSKRAIYDQLISEYGEKFTAKEAQYAIDHLDD